MADDALEQRVRRSHKKSRRSRRDSNQFASVLKSVVLVAVLAALVAGAIWVSTALTKVAKHRRRMREEDYLLPRNGNDNESRRVKSLRILDVPDLKAGDMIFSQVKRIGQQPVLGWMKDAPFMIKANLANIASVLTRPFAPTHVAVIISTHVSDIRQVELLDFNGKRTRIWSLDEFLTRRGMGTWRLWLAKLNATIPERVVHSITSMLMDDAHPCAINRTRRSFGAKEIGYMLNRPQDVGLVRLARGMQLVASTHEGRVGNNTLVRSRGFPPNAFVQTDSSSRLGWMGLLEPVHTCSSFAYAVMEYCGLVLPFYGSGSVVAMPYEVAIDDGFEPRNEDAASRTLRLIRHPKELLPHDFLRYDFQWSIGVGVTRVDELDPFAIADNQIYVIPSQ